MRIPHNEGSSRRNRWQDEWQKVLRGGRQVRGGEELPRVRAAAKRSAALTGKYAEYGPGGAVFCKEKVV